MLSKEEIEKAFEGMEYFIDDDMGGYYKSVVGNQEANSMLGYLKIRDYILNLQNKVEQLEINNKKLIEKLKEDIYYANDNIKDIDESNIAQVITKEIKISIRNYAQEILEIVKGEKE